jgi:hypothetical protein
VLYAQGKLAVSYHVGDSCLEYDVLSSRGFWVTDNEFGLRRTILFQKFPKPTDFRSVGSEAAQNVTLYISID